MKRFGVLALILAICLTMAAAGVCAGAEDQAEDLPGDFPKARFTYSPEEKRVGTDLNDFKEFGEEISLKTMMKSNGKQYKPVEEDEESDGKANAYLKADGSEKYVTIENENGRVLWAGRYSGRENEIPELILDYEVVSNNPDELLEPVEEEGASQDTSILDLTEVMEKYPEVTIQTARESGTYSAAELDSETGEVEVEKDRFILIQERDGGEEVPILWAGKLGDAQGRKFKFTVCPVWEFSIENFQLGSGQISFKFSESALEDEYAGRLALELTFKDEADEEIVTQSVPLPKIPDSGEYVYEGEIPENPAQLEARLLYDNEVVGTQTAKPTPAPTPEPTETPKPKPLEMKLDENSARCISGQITFSGTVTGGEEPFRLYEEIGEEQKEISQGILWKGASFTVKDYPVEEGVKEIKLYVEDKNGGKTEPVTLKLKRVVQVSIQDYEGVYDGEAHKPHTEETEPVQYQYAVETDWQDGLPEITDAGEMVYRIRAVKEGYEIEYGSDAEEEEGEPEYVIVTLKVLPAERAIILWAEQKGDAPKYNGEEQALEYVYKAEPEDEELAALLESWGDSVKETNAGEYNIPALNEAQIQAIRALYPNYELKLDDRSKDCKVEIKRRKVIVVSESKDEVYDPEDPSLTVDPKEDRRIEGDGFVGEMYPADIQVLGRLDGVGKTSTEFEIRPELKQDANYEIVEQPGELIIYPQRIAPDAEPYNEEEELPGQHVGMTVELSSQEAVYDGKQKQIDPVFKKNDTPFAAMKEGTDYTIEYLRDGEETDDLTNPGEITVRISGMGGYCGQVERAFTIHKGTLNQDEMAISIESWTYDGRPAGSEAHPVECNPEPDRLIYRAGGEEVAPPSDAGHYTVQAVWDATDAREGAESEEIPFEIVPAEIVVTMQDGEPKVDEKWTGLLDPNEILNDGGNYDYIGSNFKVTFQEIQNVVLTLDGWEYDGQPAGSEAHPVKPSDENVEISLHYYDEKGEEVDAPRDAGTYEVRGEAQDELVNVLPTSFTISARSIEEAALEWDGESPRMTLDGLELKQGEDYEYGDAMIRGVGNFAGEFEAIAPRRLTKVELSVDVGEEAILADDKGRISLSGRLLADAPLGEAQVELTLGGEEVSCQADGDSAMKFELKDYRLPGRAENVSLVAKVNGAEMDSLDLTIRYTSDPRLWIALAAGMAVASAACLAISLTLRKKVRREQYKLLDKVTRQSNRTIRENEE